MTPLNVDDIINDFLESLNGLVRPIKGKSNKAFRLQWLVVDALDEATSARIGDGDTEATVVDVISALIDCVDKWPPWLRLLLTCRIDATISKKIIKRVGVDSKLLEIPLDMSAEGGSAFGAELKGDTREFVKFLWNRRAAAKRDRNSGAAEAGENDPEKRELLANELIETCRCNFLLTELNFYERLKDPRSRIIGNLSGRYQLTFDRIFKGTSDARAPSTYDPFGRTLLSTIVATENTRPLSAKAIFEIVRLKQNVSKSLFAQTIGALEAFISQDEDGTIRLFHKSFSDWLRGDLNVDEHNPYEIEKDEGNILLTEYCVMALNELLHYRRTTGSYHGQHANLSSEKTNYLRNHAVDHFLDQRKFKEAVQYVHFLISIQDTGIPTPQHLGRTVLLSLAECDDEEAKSLDPDQLADLLNGVYQTDPLRHGLKILINFHAQVFFDRIRTKLLSQESYVVCFELGSILGDVCIQDDNPSYEYANILEDIENSDANVKELGCYALARYCTNIPKIGERELEDLKKLNTGETFVPRQVLGEALLNLALQQKLLAREISKILPSAETMLWQHNCINRWDVCAALSIRLGDAPPSGHEDGRAYDHLHALNKALPAMAHQFGAVNDELGKLLQPDSFYALGANEEPIDLVRDAILKLPYRPEPGWPDGQLLPFIELLFSHPSWNVGERAASALSSAIEQAKGKEREYLVDMIKGFWKPKKDGLEYHWKVQLGSIETAYISAGFLQDFFDEAVGKFYDHECCRIRGLCIEDLTDQVLDPDVGKWKERLTDPKYRHYFQRWLIDEDCWVLDHVFRLLRELKEAEYDCDTIFERPASGFLAEQPLSYWASLSRGTFLREIQKRKQEKGGSRSTTQAKAQ